MKLTAQTIIIWLFLLFVTGKSLQLYLSERSNSRRLVENLKAANERAEYFKTRDGQNAVKITAQELTISELRRISPGIISQFKNMYIAPRLVQSYTQSSQTLSAQVTASVKDSVIQSVSPSIRQSFNPSVLQSEPKPESIHKITYSDAWLKISGIVKGDSAKLKVAAIDTIFTAIHKGERRRPALWIFSKRKTQVTATNRNPYIKIKVIQSATIK